jgi:hypothetical protein
VKTADWVAAIAASPRLFGTARATPHDEVTCRCADVMVALAHGEPAQYAITGELCATGGEPAQRHERAVVHSRGHVRREYWDFAVAPASSSGGWLGSPKC